MATRHPALTSLRRTEYAKMVTTEGSCIFHSTGVAMIKDNAQCMLPEAQQKTEPPRELKGPQAALKH